LSDTLNKERHTFLNLSKAKPSKYLLERNSIYLKFKWEVSFTFTQILYCKPARCAKQCHTSFKMNFSFVSAFISSENGSFWNGKKTLGGSFSYEESSIKAVNSHKTHNSYMGVVLKFTIEKFINALIHHFSCLRTSWFSKFVESNQE